MQELDLGGGNLLLRLGMLRMNADAEEGNRQSPEHSETDAGKRVPAQVYRAQAHGKGPEQRGGLEDVKHDLAFHILKSILVLF
jgi:hypothetical protein